MSFLRAGSALVTILVLTAGTANGQFEGFGEPGLVNETELSLVVTEGNSNTETLGFKHLLRRTWERSRYRLKLEGVRANTADDRFALVDTDAEGGFVLIEPPSEIDVEKYLIENRYDRRIGDGRAFWNVGAGWDRNRDAGILSRYTGFAGAGHLWIENEKGELSTTYGLSYTIREEETDDPEKDDNFGGARLGLSFERALGAVTKYTSELAFNTNFKDPDDYSSDLTNAVAVAMSDRLALKLSLQWLYNSEPALESIDLIEIADGSETTVGTVDVRKKPSDLVLNASLVISF